MRGVVFIGCVSLCLLGCGDDPTGGGSQPDQGGGNASGGSSFTKDVAPILVSSCGNCHIRQTKGQYSLVSYAAMMQDSGKGPMVVAGNPGESRLIELVETGEMPKMGQLDPTAVQTLKNWVAKGAEFDGPDPNAALAGLVPGGMAPPGGGRGGPGPRRGPGGNP